MANQEYHFGRQAGCEVLGVPHGSGARGFFHHGSITLLIRLSRDSSVGGTTYTCGPQEEDL